MRNQRSQQSISSPPPQATGATSCHTISSVLDVVSGNGLCVGCGMCAGMLPDALRMEVNEYGAYVPKRTEEPGEGGWEQKSLTLCPFADNGKDEDAIASQLFSQYPGIKHRSETGYFLNCLAGHIANEQDRLLATSGGILTWLIGDLLNTGAVDAAVCVGTAASPGSLFSYQVVRDPADLTRCKKSRYYPVEMSQVIQAVRASDDTVAFVGLPCFIKAVRFAAMQDPVLQARIRYTIGLFCGHLKSRHFAAYLSRCCGVHERDVITVDFRKKVPQHHANDYAFEVTGEENGAEVRRQVMMSDVVGGSWGYGLFKLDACDCCDDVMAETADVSVGDAWLPKFIPDYRGTSLVIIRQPDLSARFTSGIERGELHLEEVSVDQVIRSQSGGLHHRRAGLSYRLHLAEKKGEWHPPKRVAPNRRALSFFYRVVHHLRLRIKQRSREAFLQQQSVDGVGLFVKRIRPWLVLYDTLYGIRRFAIRIKRLLMFFR